MKPETTLNLKPQTRDLTVSLLVAAAENNVIGRNNQLPWRLPNDLKFFKNTSWGMPVVMGRKTFESFGKPLRGRTNIVITRQEDWKYDGVETVRNIPEALEAARKTDAKEVFIIGGGEIFREIIESADRIYLTRVHAKVDGDIFFPDFSPNEWRLLHERNMQKDDRHQYDYSFQLWEKIQKTPG